MSQSRKQVSRRPGEIVKRCSDEPALKNIVSLRVSDEEMATLARISTTTSQSISEIMREALRAFQAQRRRLCPDT